jgi:hypothetical protein
MNGNNKKNPIGLLDALTGSDKLLKNLPQIMGQLEQAQTQVSDILALLQKLDASQKEIIENQVKIVDLLKRIFSLGELIDEKSKEKSS